MTSSTRHRFYLMLAVRNSCRRSSGAGVCVILRDFLRDFTEQGVSKDLVHELPRSPGRASTPHSVVFQGYRAPRDHATLLLRVRPIDRAP